MSARDMRRCNGDPCTLHEAHYLAPTPTVPMLDVAWLTRLQEWSQQVFGPRQTPLGVLEHVRKELGELQERPDALEEWADVILLGLDGAHRAGGSPAEILTAVRDKAAVNEQRRWPDWRVADPDGPMEHDRSHDG